MFNPGLLQSVFGFKCLCKWWNTFPIYKEGDGMVWRENGSDLLRDPMWLEASSKMTLWRSEMVRFEIVPFTTPWFWFLAPNRNRQRQWNDLLCVWTLTIFGKILKTTHGSGSLVCKLSTSNLNFIWALVCCIMCYKSIETRLAWIETMVIEFAKSAWHGLTCASWQVPISEPRPNKIGSCVLHQILCQMFLSMYLI